MRIAWIAPEYPLPADSGGKEARLNMLRAVSAAGADIYLFCLSSELDIPPAERLLSLCESCQVYHRTEGGLTGLGRMLARAVWDGLITKPYPVFSRWNRQMYDDVQALCSTSEVDLVHVELGMMAEYLKGVGDVPSAITVHNLQSRTFRTVAEFSAGLRSHAFTTLANWMRKYEDSVVRDYGVDRWLFFSQHEKELFKRRYRSHDVQCFMTPPPFCGEEACKERPEPRDTHDGRWDFVFVGTMSYPPNVDAAVWFCEEVLPQIESSQRRESTVCIVGRDPVNRVKRLASDNDSVTVTGRVDTVEPYYRESRIAVVPVRTGGGVKTKLVGALEHGIPTVCRPEAVEGTPLENGDGVSIARSSYDFAQACTGLLRDRPAARRQAARGHEVVCSTYTVDAYAKHWSRSVRDCVE